MCSSDGVKFHRGKAVLVRPKGTAWPWDLYIGQPVYMAISRNLSVSGHN